MAREEFEIEISPTGEVTIRTKGIKGPACIEAAQLLAQLLGEEKTRELTHEYHEAGSEIDEHLRLRLKR